MFSRKLCIENYSDCKHVHADPLVVEVGSTHAHDGENLKVHTQLAHIWLAQKIIFILKIFLWAKNPWSALAASVDGVGEAGGGGGGAGEPRVLYVGAVLVDLGVAVLSVDDEDAAYAKAEIVNSL